MIARHQIKINFSLTPNSTSNNTYRVFDISLFHLSIHEVPFINISCMPGVLSFSMKFVILKLTIVLISSCKYHSTISLSTTLNKIPFINVTIWPHHFAFSMKFSVNKISTVFLVISSCQSAFAVLHIISPRSFIDCMHRFRVYHNSINFFTVFVPSSVD